MSVKIFGFLSRNFYLFVDIMNKKGIYKIVNKTNGKYYVGSSINVDVRIRGHKLKLRKNIHENPKLQSSFNKHGIDNFDFIFVEPIEVNENLLLIEQKYLDICKENPILSYNLNYNAEMPRLGTKHSDKSKKQMTESRSDKLVYSFFNVVTNETFVGKRREFYTTFNLHPQGVYEMIKGNTKSTKNWTLFQKVFCS